MSRLPVQKNQTPAAALLIALILLLPACLLAQTSDGQFEAQAPQAASVAADDSLNLWFDTQHNRIKLYFFWTASCPHCQAARPFISDLAGRASWLEIHSLPLDENPENIARYLSLAEQIDETAYSVPAFLFCGHLLSGFDSAATTGALLETSLRDCRNALREDERPWEDSAPQSAATSTSTLPFLGDYDLSKLSLPAVTILLAAMDSFNPCAFFVLLFLLSLLVNARSRSRMLLIGGLFVFVSGMVYLAFMAAWLNLFLLFGELAWLTFGAGLLAVVMGIINLKDYFYDSSGVSLSIPDSAKPGLFARMRRLVSAESLPAMITGTLLLAILANSYELLCTAGFPMVFTRILTLHDLSSASYYGYLVLYCTIYIVPLLIIVALFARTLGRRKLSAAEGRILKLLSGLMMTGLGILLVVNPALISNPGIAVLLIVAAVAGCWLINLIHNRSAVSGR